MKNKTKNYYVPLSSLFYNNNNINKGEVREKREKKKKKTGRRKIYIESSSPFAVVREPKSQKNGKNC